MERSVIPAEGDWWRFDRYEIRNGHIRPAPAARLERYDPWETWRLTGPSKVTTGVPYLSLLELLAEMRSEIRVDTTESYGDLEDTIPDDVSSIGHDLVQLSTRQEQAIINWCCHHGLLGILSQQALTVNLWPRWQHPRAPSTKWEAPKGLWSVYSEHIRTPLGWESQSHIGGLRSDVTDRRGEILTQDEIPQDTPAGTVIWFGREKRRWEAESLSRRWAGFFPDVPAEQRDTYAYPVPLSDAFWYEYAEPVVEFIGAAMSWSVVIEELAEVNKVLRSRGKSAAPEAIQRFVGVEQRAHDLLESVHPALVLRNGSFQQRWASTSLLATYSMMAFLELTASDRHIRSCEACGQYFTTSSDRARYCSRTCRYRMQKRRQRANGSTPAP